MKKFLLLSLMAMIAIISHAGENDLLWDYTNAEIPTNTKDATTGIYNDNGLYYSGYVNDSGKNLGLYGVKLNSTGYAYFEKAAVAGKLKLKISNRTRADLEFKVDVYRGSLVNGVPQRGELIATTAAAQGPQEVTVELDEKVTGIYMP